MEARLKLQAQLDTLLTRTSAKMAVYTSERRSEEKTKEVEEVTEDLEVNKSKEGFYPEVDNDVKSLIKSVAKEIQKSFSRKNLNVNEEDENEEIKTEDENEAVENGETSNDAANDKPEFNEEPTQTVTHLEPTVEDPIDFDSVPVVLDISMHREKLKIVRKSSQERRLPAGIIAKKKAAEKLKDLIKISETVAVNNTDIGYLNGMNDTETTDEEKAELLAKEMSKLEHSQVLQILQSVEKGILEFSIPMLIPFLSLQVKLSLSKNIYNELDTSNKTELVKESIIDSLVNDITDIAILQEVIDRSQAKLNTLKDDEHMKESFTQSDIHEMKDAMTSTETDESRCENSCCILNNALKPSIKAKDEDDQQNEIKTDFTAEDSVIETLKTDVIDSIITKEPETPKITDDLGSLKEENKEDNSQEPSKYNDSDKSDDSGVDSEESHREEKISKSKSEKDIKKAIMGILNDVKAQESSRNVRNYGRTFEYQPPKLTTVIPNDRRPPKAKKMDAMWNKSIAAKQINYNGIPSPKPAAKVPWTMKGTASHVKKDSILYDKEVEEFEKCRTALKDNKTMPGKGAAIKFAEARKVEEVKTTENIENQKVVIEKIRDSPCDVEKVDISEKREEQSGVTVEKTVRKTKHENETSHDTSDTADSNAVKSTDSTIKEDLTTKTPNESGFVNTDQSTHDLSSSSDSECDIGSESEDESESQSEKKMAKTIPALESNKLNQAIQTTPITRRRMEMANVLTFVLPIPRSGPPPPPPSFRPPPPPMSPPAVSDSSKIGQILASTTARFENLKREATSPKPLSTELSLSQSVSPLIIDEDPKSQSVSLGIMDEDPKRRSVSPLIKDEASEDDTDASEWEWTDEEVLDDSEDTKAVVKNEKWQNVMAGSGPTTFSAEFSIKI